MGKASIEKRGSFQQALLKRDGKFWGEIGAILQAELYHFGRFKDNAI